MCSCGSRSSARARTSRASSNPAVASTKALYAVVTEAYVHSVSTSSVDDLVVALGADSGNSKSEVSRICEQLEEVVGAFRTRPLDHTAFPYLYLDATYLHVRNKPGKGGQVVSTAVVVATGIAADGSREILGLNVGDSEDETFWRAFLLSLKQRGLSGVQLVISDQHSGLVAAEAVLPGLCPPTLPSPLRPQPARPRAIVPRRHGGRSVPHDLRAQPDPEAVNAAWDEVRDQLAGSFPKVGPLMDDAKVEVLAFTGFPKAHWRKIWSTNPLERVNKEIKRRSRVVRIFSEPGRRDQARRCGPHRHARRMDRRRPPLPIGGVHGDAQ
jgi:putative transposase